jgi:Anti-sigma factor NepR
MVGADKAKASSESQLDVKQDNRSRGGERGLGHINRQQEDSRMTENTHRQDTAMADRWLDRQLNQLYSDVISEPLPKEFVELIEKLREKTPK